MNSFWKNGHWLRDHDLSIAAGDRGLLVGLGLFETFLALDGHPIFLNRHLARMQRSCTALGWEFPVVDFSEIARELLHRQSLTVGAARCRLTLTAGSGPLNHLSSTSDFSVWMSAHALAATPDAASACLCPWPRNEHSPLSGHKSTSYAENALALDHARRHGFDQALFFNTANQLCEAATANVFLVKNGALHTPPVSAGCLPGVTREVIFELAQAQGIRCYSDEPLTLRDLDSADEWFLTSSLHGVVPLTRLAERQLPIGPVTCELRALYHTRLRNA